MQRHTLRSDQRTGSTASLEPAEATIDQGDFVRLLVQNQHRIYGFILSLVPNFAHADDLYQETCAVLWQKFAQFEPGTDFFRWASAVARFKVLKFRERQRRDGLQFGEEFTAAVDAEIERQGAELGQRQLALAECLQRLPDADRQLLRARYEGDVKVETIAAQRQRTPFAIYKALSRIRGVLLQCIERRVAAEAAL